MIRGGFLSPRQRAELIALLRDGRTEQRLARRANAVLLLDDGWSCERAAKALYLDDDTIRGWRRRAAALRSRRQRQPSFPSARRGTGRLRLASLAAFDAGGGRVHRTGVRRRLDALEQQAFIDAYEKLLNSLGPDEATLFVDAVHPTYAARSVGCWAPAGEALAVRQTSGRERLNIHGALDLETGKTAMIEVESVDAVSTIKLLEAIEAKYPFLVTIHVFLDNARYHHAVLVQEWLEQPRRRVRLHFIPTYCPHLNPIERLL